MRPWDNMHGWDTLLQPGGVYLYNAGNGLIHDEAEFDSQHIFSKVDFRQESLYVPSTDNKLISFQIFINPDPEIVNTSAYG